MIPQTPPAAPPVRISLPLNPVRLTYFLLGAIGLVFAAQSAAQAMLGEDLVMYLGAKINGLILEGEVWRLVTPIFVHGSLMHVLFNLYALYSLGRETESVAGGLRFGLVFFLSGVGGSVASLYLNRHASVGASGAIFGLIGLQGVFLYLNRKLLGERARRALQNVAAIVLLNLFLGMQGGIDNWAHLGGLVSGGLLGWQIAPRWALAALQNGLPGVVDQRPMDAGSWLSVAVTAGLLAGLVGIKMAL